MNTSLGREEETGYNLVDHLDVLKMDENLRLRILYGVGILILVFLLRPTPINQVTQDSFLAAQKAVLSGRPEAALEHLKKVLEYYPWEDPLRLPAAKIAIIKGENALALQYLLTVEDNPQIEKELYCIRAEALLGLHNRGKALEFWELADRQCSDFPQKLLPLINELIEKGDLEEAEKILRLFNEVQPQDAEIQFSLGMIISTYAPVDALVFLRSADDLSQNENSFAQQLYRVIEDAQIFENPAFILASVGRTFASIGNWEYASHTLRNAVALQPDYAEAYAYLGLSLDQMDENGIVELLKAIELDPDNAIAHLFLGMHWLDQKKVDMALIEFDRAIALDPMNPAIIVQIGTAYEIKGEIQNALQSYRAAAEIDTQDPQFWLLLSQKSLQYEYEVSEIALPAARNALALNPHHAPSLDALGYSYYLLGDMIFAEEFIQQAVELDPSLAVAQYHLGLLKSQQNETEAAIAALKRAQELDLDGSLGLIAQRTIDTLLP